MTAAVAVRTPVALEVETPQQRAYRRVEELRRTAAGVMEILAQIYLDEDWKYLTDDSGTAFSGFTAFVQHTLGGSASNARRYRQGVETLVAPLQELTAEGTRIPVTPNDIVQLGRGGAQAVVEAAPTALAGVTDPDAQTAALRGLLDEAIAETHSGVGHLPGAAAVPEIPATVPPAALGDGNDEDMWDSDPDPEGSAALDPDPDDADYTALRDALQSVLALDPISAAGEISAAHSPRLAADCLSAAQRLARIAQLLKALR